MAYAVEVRRSVQKTISRLDKPLRERLYNALRNLADDPRPYGAKKLSNRDGWRIRVGEYRVIYEVFDDRLVVVVIRIGHRREVYE